MAPELLVLFPVSIACDVAGQMFLKRGADTLPDAVSASSSAFLGNVARNRWLLLGLIICGAEMFIWLRILTLVPLSVAFPIASINFLGVTVAGRLFFKEAVGGWQWLGCLMVTAGVAIVATSTSQ